VFKSSFLRTGSLEPYPPAGVNPSVDGRRVVWAEGTGTGRAKIQLYDIATAETKTIVTTDLPVVSTQLSGVYVAYQTSTENVAPARFVYDLATGATRQVDPSAVIIDLASAKVIDSKEAAGDDGVGYGLFVGDKWIVSMTSTGLWCYNPATKEKLRVPSTEGARFDALDGDTLYYVPGAGGDMITGGPQELRAYDLASDADVPISAEPNGIQWTTAEGGRVAWASWDKDGPFITLLDRASGKATRVPSPGYQVGVLQLKGDLLVWRGMRGTNVATISGDHVFVYDIANGIITRLTNLLTDGGHFSTDGENVCIGQLRFAGGKTYEDMLVFGRKEPAGEAGAPVPSDVPGAHPYRTAVAGLLGLGAMADADHPEGEGLYRPDEQITRGEFVGVMARALEIPEAEANPADDEILGSVGLSMTRVQLVAAIVRAAEKYRPDLLAGLTGWPGVLGEFDPVYAPYLTRAEWAGLVDGLVGYGKTWDPFKKASRGEAAQVLWNLASWGR